MNKIDKSEFSKAVEEIKEEVNDKKGSSISKIPKQNSKSLLEGERVKNNSRDYREVANNAKAHRHEIINNLIENLISPLEEEQKSKNRFRKIVLVSFSIYFASITILSFIMLFCFSSGGYTSEETKVASILITGLFANLVGLAIIIFKYLFDDKNSLLKDMIQLVVKTIENKEPK